MANRHLARGVVLQSLFEWDFNSFPEESIDDIIERNLAEFAPGMAEGAFPHRLVKGVLEKRQELDTIIEKAAPEWPIAQISIIDRNILRIGLFELLFTDRKEVPAKVAINESIELAKSFGGETSGRFVNGVLGTVYKELGEPGKDDVRGGKKKKNGDLDLSKLPIERLGGAVIVAEEDGESYVALVHDIFGYWTLPKGRIEGAESEEEGTKREVHEEIGLDIEVGPSVGRNEYIASDPVKGKIRKQVAYFVAESPKTELDLKVSGGLDDAKWFLSTELDSLAMYDDIRPIVAKALQ